MYSCDSFQNVHSTNFQHNSMYNHCVYVYRVPLKYSEAASARDALAKAIYSRLFDYIVLRLNQSIPLASTANFIGLLDIAGFGMKFLVLQNH